MRLAAVAAAFVIAFAAPAAAGVGKYGPPGAARVLVLVPGLGGGAGNFSLIAPELVARVPNLQVWTVDRRGDDLEDPTGFATGDPGAAYGYYLGGVPANGRTFDANVAFGVPQARAWGAAFALADLRRVVLAARAGGKRKVFLGGHSLGAATAAAYATWDFTGRAGYRDLTGLVLIDGGALGTFGTPTLGRVRSDLAALATQPTPFEDRLGVGVPWLFGVFAQLAALHAQLAPDAPSALAQSPLVPPEFRLPGAPTNAEFFAYALGPAGIDVANCGLENAARMVGARGQNSFDWYFPTRLRIDLLGASSLRLDPVTRLLGLRVRHLREVDVPVYAFATRDVPRTLDGARKLVSRSRSPRSKALLVRDPRLRHVDPLCTPYSKSRFLQTLVRWLR